MTSPAGGSQNDAVALQARIAALETENERLAAIADTALADAAIADTALADTEVIEPLAEPAARPRATGRWRAVVSALCIVIAAILVPASIVSAWARAELVDPDRFVSTFGPLVDDTEVQAMLIDEVTAAVNDQVDIQGLTNDLFDGIAGLDLPPRALTAIDLLRAPAAQGAQSLVTQTATRVVESDAFADVWDTALRASHRGLVAAATGGTEGAITIDGQGVVGIQLAPIITEVKQRLIDQGFGFASAIPVVDKTIIIAQSDALVTVRVVYGLAVTIGWWLPVIALVFFVAGVLIARRKSTALLGSGVALAVSGTALALGIVTGGTVLGLQSANLGVPAGALAAIYQQASAAMHQTAVVAAVIGLIVAVLAWSRGRWRGAVATRSAIDGVNASLRRTIAERGAGTGGFGVWMDRQRVLVRVAIAALAVLSLWMLRPLGVAEIFSVLLVALLVWWICELVRAPAASEATASEAATIEASGTAPGTASGETE